MLVVHVTVVNVCGTELYVIALVKGIDQTVLSYIS